MTGDVHKHLGHYTILAGIVMTGLMLLAAFRANPAAEQLVVIGTSLAYVVWGVAHHQAIGDLSRRVMLEYLMIAALVTVLLNAIIVQR